MTKKQLERFIKIRNKARFNTNLQFAIDAQEAGFNPDELGDASRVSYSRGTQFEWSTPYGKLTERNGRLSLETEQTAIANP